MTSDVAVVVIDVQRGFCDPRTPSIGHFEKAICVPGVRRLLEYARTVGWRVIHVITVHDAQGELPVHLRRSGVVSYCQRGSEDTALIGEVARAGDEVLEKTSYSAFSCAELPSRLSAVSEVVIAGLAVDCCVLNTAFDAANRGYAVSVPLEAVSASSRGNYVHGLKFIAKSLGAVCRLSDIEGGEDRWASRLDETSLESESAAWFDLMTSGVDAITSQLEDNPDLTIEQAITMIGEQAAEQAE